MKKVIFAAFAASIFAVSACASSSGANSMTKKSGGDDAWNKEFAAAKADLKALKKIDARWRDTGDWGKGKKEGFLRKAKFAYGAGKKDKAAKLMKKVNFQNKMAAKQFDEQKNAKPHY